MIGSHLQRPVEEDRQEPEERDREGGIVTALRTPPAEFEDEGGDPGEVGEGDAEPDQPCPPAGLDLVVAARDQRSEHHVGETGVASCQELPRIHAPRDAVEERQLVPVERDRVDSADAHPHDEQRSGGQGREADEPAIHGARLTAWDPEADRPRARRARRPDCRGLPAGGSPPR